MLGITNRIFFSSIPKIIAIFAFVDNPKTAFNMATYKALPYGISDIKHFLMVFRISDVSVVKIIIW